MESQNFIYKTTIYSYNYILLENIIKFIWNKNKKNVYSIM